MSTYNLPAQSNTFVGRTRELAEIATLLAEPGCRLLTLVGPGGIGKTRLALEAAAQMKAFPDGVHFVGLQSLSSAEYIVPAIADTLNFQFYPGGEPKQQLLNYLRKKHLLLILDNFEHLLDGVSLVGDVLTHTPNARFVVTSRERLNLSVETVFNVQGMSVPDYETADNLLDYSSVKLFIQAARRVRPSFKLKDAELPLAARICRLVGGMPLALLMAAGWVEMLPLEDIAREIAQNLDYLEVEMRDLPERQRSIRATFDYSWWRLSDSERDSFKKLSVFRGSFSRQAAEGIATVSMKTLKGLVNKSFVQAAPGGRYDLHQLLRQYGEEKLHESPEEYKEVHHAHCQWYAEFCAKRADEFRGSQEHEALEAMDIELEDVRGSWEWAVDHARYESLWQLVFPLWWFYYLRNREHTSVSTLDSAILAVAERGHEEDELVFTLLVYQTFHAKNLGGALHQQAQKAVTILNQLDNVTMRREATLAIGYLGYMTGDLGNLSECLKLMESSIKICRSNNYLFELATGLTLQLWVFINRWFEGNFLEPQALLDEVVEIGRRLGNPYYYFFVSSMVYAEIALQQGNYGEAKRLFLEAYPTAKKINEWTAIRLDLAQSLQKLGEYEEARWYCEDTLRRIREVGTTWNRLCAVATLAQILAATGQEVRAVELASATVENFFSSSSRRASDYVYLRDYAQPLLNALEAELPAEVFAAALERGKAHDFETLVDELLAEVRPSKQSILAASPQSGVDSLTEREREVLRLLAAGRSNREIAKELLLALGTVKWYISEIYSKLAVASRTQAIARARELNLLS